MPDQITKLPRGVSADKYLDQIRAAAFDAFLEVLRGKSDDPGIDLTNLLSAIRTEPKRPRRPCCAQGN